ncbi:MAG: EAL domain-containing protein [Cyanobacteria bacterium P01_A01_bin.123]
MSYREERGSLVLVVDDEIEIERLLRQRFRKSIQAGELNFQFVQNGVEALQVLNDAEDQIDMVLTDIRMPEMDGLTLLTNLAELETPLKAVVISAYGDMENIRTAMNRGAFDFLTKPIDMEDLEITINKTLTFVAHLRHQQQQLQEALDRLHNLVFYDQLTGLLNQNGLAQQVAQSIATKQTHGNEFALILLDIKRYSIIKSGFGHALSNRLIVEAAERLKQATNSSLTPARIGENIFAILWRSLNNLNDIQEHVEQSLQLLEPPFQLDEITVSSTTAVGIALSTLPYLEPDDFFQAADTAMQIAKHQKRNDFVIFDIQMQEAAIQRLNLEAELQKAIEAQHLSLYYQPIFRLDTQKIVSFEALIRWRHPKWEQVPPLSFIPLAEESGLIVPLGEWVISEACHQFARWQAQFGVASPNRISINLSSLQLQSPTLLQCIDNSLRSARLDGNALTLEITESVLMENIKEITKLLVQLQERGIHLSIDDFGTGYSSLSYLQLLPINTLKIDSCFIKDIEVNPTNFDITSTIIDLAHNLDLEVVAEGLEKEEHVNILNSLTCQYGQGFIFSYPLDSITATALISQNISQ